MVVAGSLKEHVHTRHLYLSTCAHTVVLDTSRCKADAEAAVPSKEGRLSLNFQVYEFYTPQTNVIECNLYQAFVPIKPIQLSATDLLALASMKNAAKCDK